MSILFKKVVSIFFLFIFVSSCGVPLNNKIGVKESKLSPCPSTPNCVCSQAQTDDKEHYILPFSYNTSKNDAYKKIKELIQLSKRTKIISETDDYIHVEYTSMIFRFIDDVEFYFPKEEKLIHVRSASRLGKSDIGVNRKRIESLRKQF